MTPEVVDMEERLAETLGTRVQIEPRERGGRIWIDYFSHEELLALSIAIRKAGEEKTHKGMFDTLKEENMEILKAVPNTERYIKPITEFTHLKENGVPAIEIIKEIDHLPLAKVEEIQTSSEAFEQDSYVTRSVTTENTEGLNELHHDDIFEPSKEALDDRSLDEVKAEEQNDDLYNLTKFTI